MASYELIAPDGRRYQIVGPGGEAESELQGPPVATPAPAPVSPMFGKVQQFGSDVIAGGAKAASLLPYAASFLTPGPRVSPERGQAAQAQLQGASEKLSAWGQGFGERNGLPAGFGKTIGESLGGGMAFGGVTPLAMAGAAASGATSELAARVLGDSAVNRLLGGLVGGGVVAATGNRIRNTKDLAQQIAQELDPAVVKKAELFQKSQAARGIQVDLAQALEAVGVPRGKLASIRDLLANNPNGKAVQETLHQQPQQLAKAAKEIAKELPGVNSGPAAAANRLQKAATDMVNAVKAGRSGAVADLYAKAGVITGEQVKELDQIAARLAGAAGATDDVKAAAGVFRQKLRGTPDTLVKRVEAARAALAAAEKGSEKLRAQRELEKANRALDEARATPVRAADVNTWIREMVGPFKGTPLTPVDPMAAGQMKHLGKSVNEAFKEFSPEVKEASETFAELSKKLVNPVKQSVVGQIATPRGYLPDVQATMGKFEALMQRGTDANAKVSDIRTLGEQLAKVDKNAFSDALKSYVGQRIKQAMAPSTGAGVAAVGANNTDMAVRIARNLWGSELQAQGLKDAVAVSAKAQGQDPAAAVRGVENLMQLVRAMESRPGLGVGGLRPEDIAQTGGRNAISTGLRSFGIAPLATPANRMFEVVLGATLRQFDDILTSPEGARLLVKLGREPIISRRIPILLGQFGAQAGVSAATADNPAGIMAE